MINIKILPMKLGILFAVLLGTSILHAGHHRPKITTRPVECYFTSASKIYLLSSPQTPPIYVKLEAGHRASVCMHKCGELFRGPFSGNLSCSIDNKPVRIAFVKTKHKKLWTRKENIKSSSVWYKALNSIIKKNSML